MRLPGPGSDGERLQHLRSVLPCRVRVTAASHPLFGDVLEASGFKRWNGELLLVVRLLDDSPGTVRAESTDVFVEPAAATPTPLAMDGAGIQRLYELVTALQRQRLKRPRNGK